MSAKELNIGDYVRTKNEIIGKIVDINLGDFQTRYELDNSDEFHYEYKNDIIKSSPNIMDLIQKDDYVNGMKVFEVIKNPEVDDKKHFHLLKFNSYFRNEDIKSIVTKEQFESMEYKIGE